MTLREKLRRWLDDHHPPRIEPAHVAELLAALAPVKEPSLRRALRESGWRLAPLVEGVRQDSLDNLHRTLSALAGEYEHNPAPARQAVLTARRHLDWKLRRKPDDPALRETLLWLRTWLENPGVFSTWASLRRHAAAIRIGSAAVKNV